MGTPSPLNPAQNEAVNCIKGPLLIVAGAGAGKTKTLTHRIAHIIENGVAPERILAVTFTNKAAQEMKERVGAILEGDRPWQDGWPFIGTFHNLGVHILREHGEAVGVPRRFSIADRQDGISLIKEALREQGLDPKEHEPRGFQNAISRYKGELVSVDSINPSEVRGEFLSLLLPIWRKYEALLRKNKTLDFDDLLLKPTILLQEHQDIRTLYQKRFQYIHIDEYQDTNTVQYEFVRMLTGPEKNICVVGDADQTIYGWRGANVKNILNFEKDYPDAKVVLLEENYRSTQNILAAANAVIKKNTIRKEKNLFTKNHPGALITAYESYDEGDEARYVANTSARLIESGVPAGEIAVLYRANFQSRALEEAFLSRKIPYQVLGTRFFERREIKDVVSFLRAAQNPDSLADLKRVINVPPRGIGKVTIAKIFSGGRASLTGATKTRVDDFYTLLSEIQKKSTADSLSETIKFIISRSGLETALRAGSEDDRERLENMRELVSLATKYDGSSPERAVEDFLADIALATDQDEMNEKVQAVRLMTVHAAKGLEFRHVFITGLEQGLFPYEMQGQKRGTDEQEEERRLFYVAITRAKEKLYLTHAAVRTIFGARLVATPSEFLSDIDQSIIEKDPSDKGGLLATIYLD